jgi:hypothetical protein
MWTLTVFCPGTDELYIGAYGGLVNLLTRGEKEHIINTKDWCGPGGARSASFPFVSWWSRVGP